MLSIRIVEGHNRFAVAHITNRSLLYRGKTYVPRELRPLEQSHGDLAGGLAGAAAGGALLGTAGMIAGAAIGGRGRTAFVLTTASGKELVGSVPAGQFAELYVEIQRLKRLTEADIARLEGKTAPILIPTLISIGIIIAIFVVVIANAA